jgi:hypothetical protein
MDELSSQAVETGTLENAPAEGVPAALRATRAWPWREARGWRYALLRRMLALADVSAALIASVLVVMGGGDAAQLMWSLVFLPAWILLAKLLGLYDRDQRAFRHLTVD